MTRGVAIRALSSFDPELGFAAFLEPLGTFVLPWVFLVSFELEGRFESDSGGRTL